MGCDLEGDPGVAMAAADVGPITHDPPCPVCHHGWHHFLPCECGCALPPAPGID